MNSWYLHVGIVLDWNQVRGRAHFFRACTKGQRKDLESGFSLEFFFAFSSRVSLYSSEIAYSVFSKTNTNCSDYHKVECIELEM